MRRGVDPGIGELLKYQAPESLDFLETARPVTASALAGRAQTPAVPPVERDDPCTFAQPTWLALAREELIREGSVGTDRLETVNVLVDGHLLMHRKAPPVELVLSPARLTAPRAGPLTGLMHATGYV